MSIPAKRFEFTDNQNLVPTKDFYSIDDAGVLNGAVAGVTAAKEALSGSLFGLFSGNRSASINGIVNSALGLDNVSLTTKLGIGKLLPGVNIPSFNITKALAGNGINVDSMLNFAFGNSPTFKNIFKTLSSDCLNDIFSNMRCPSNSGGFAFNGLTKYGNIGSCNLSNFTNLLNQYTGGNIPFSYSNICAQSSILRSVTGTSGSMGIPTFFSTMVANNTELSPVSIVNSGTLSLNDSILSDNPYTFMDVASTASMNNSPLNNGLLDSILPSAINSASTNFSIPTTLRNTQNSGFFDELSDSYSSINSVWNKTTDGIASLAKVVGTGVLTTANNSYDNFTKLVTTGLDSGNKSTVSDLLASSVDVSNLDTTQNKVGFGFYNSLVNPTSKSAFKDLLGVQIT